MPAVPACVPGGEVGTHDVDVNTRCLDGPANDGPTVPTERAVDLDVEPRAIESDGTSATGYEITDVTGHSP